MKDGFSCATPIKSCRWFRVDSVYQTQTFNFTQVRIGLVRWNMLLKDATWIPKHLMCKKYISKFFVVVSIHITLRDSRPYTCRDSLLRYLESPPQYLEKFTSNTVRDFSIYRIVRDYCGPKNIKTSKDSCWKQPNVDTKFVRSFVFSKKWGDEVWSKFDRNFDQASKPQT